MFPRLLRVMFLVAALAPNTAMAAEIEELVRQADRVVVGTTGVSVSRWDGSSRIIITETTVHVSRVVKGPATAQVVVSTPGGMLPENNVAMIVPDMPRFARNEDVVLFLRDDHTGRSQVVGGAAGKLHVRRDATTGERLVGRSTLESLLLQIGQAAR